MNVTTHGATSNPKTMPTNQHCSNLNFFINFIGQLSAPAAVPPNPATMIPEISAIDYPAKQYFGS
jgi:hypothetical protein